MRWEIVSYTPEFTPYSPNLNTLSGRMKYAANVLEEASLNYRAFEPNDYPWCADKLRTFAEEVEKSEPEDDL